MSSWENNSQAFGKVRSKITDVSQLTHGNSRDISVVTHGFPRVQRKGMVRKGEGLDRILQDGLGFQ